MVNAEEILDYLIDAIASRVVAKLREADGSSWPDTEPAVADTKKFERTIDRLKADSGTSGAEDPGDAIVTPTPEPEEPSRMQVRTEHWMSVDVRKLRKLLMAFEDQPAEYYKDKSKADLADYAARLEALTGKDLDVQSSEEEDTQEDLPEPVVADEVESPDDNGGDTSEDLTYEEALKLDLDELKQIALNSGFSSDELKGLDVDAVVDLLFEEDKELGIDDLLNMDMGELAKIADELQVDVPDNISRQDLALRLVELAGSE